MKHEVASAHILFAFKSAALAYQLYLAFVAHL